MSSGDTDQLLGGANSEFSEVPRLELDELLAQLVDRAQDVIGAQSRLRGLLRANRMIVGNLALPVVLRRIVEAACELLHARYGALGVIGDDGGLEQFIHVGIDDQTAVRIGHLPEGKGLLGALIDDPRPIRLQVIAEDYRSVGFPENHPPMSSFLGVPIRIRDEVFGNLYLSERVGGEFTAEDEELASALAATAASVIENARLYAQAQRKQDWLQASTEVTRQLLSVDGEQPLEVIARRLAELAEADVVTVVLPTFERTQLMIEVATGEGAEELTAATYPFKGTLSGLAIETGKPVLVSDVKQELKFSVHLSTAVEIGPAMAIPLLGYQGARGALLVGRKHGRKRFTDADLEMATTFASHATVALELADARADQQRMVLLEDRDRIARDLHDHVIQRLFSVGLTVQGVSSGLGGTELGGTDKAARLSRVVEDIDETIRQIRTSIFELRGSLVPDSSTLRQQLLETVTGTAEMLGFAPRVRFSGPIDAVVPESLADDLIAVLLESLTNVARHANATRVDVEISADSATLSVDILDDGMGIGDTLRRSGLRNLRQRAEKHGGTLTLPEHEGTHLRWTIPLV